MKILVFIQDIDNKINSISLEALVPAQKIKNETNGEVHAVLFNSSGLAEELKAYNLDSIIVANEEILNTYNPLHYLKALNDIYDSIKPDLIFFGHSYETRDWVPRLSAKLDVPFISDCTNCQVSDNAIHVTRPIYQAKLNQVIKVKANQAIISFQAGSFSIENIESGTSNPNTISADLSEVKSTIRPEEKFSETSGGVDLSTAEIIVSIGRGIGKEENIPLAQSLADKLNAQVGSSRPVVDAGWLDHSRQIGSSGQTVSPKLYFSIGVSGAIQHLVGMKGSKNIIAINKDANAPIFEIADYAVIGDLLEIIPKLIEKI